MDLDRITEALQISRGNASMCLKELRNWGVAHKESRPGDRKDYFATGDDIWAMFLSIASARKQREFDPAARAVHELVAEVGPTKPRSARRDRRDTHVVSKRLRDLDALLRGLDRLASAMLHASSTPGLLKTITRALHGSGGRKAMPR